MTVDTPVASAPDRVRRSMSSRTQGLGLNVLVAIASALPFLLAPVRASWLGPEARGGFAYVQSALMAVTALGALGVRYAAYASGGSGDERPRLGPTIAAGTALATIAAVPLAVVGARTVSPMVGAAVAATVLLVPGTVLFQSELARAQQLRDDRRAAAAIVMPGMVDLVLNLVTVATRTLTLTSSVVVTFAAEAWRGLSAARSRLVAGGVRSRDRAAGSRLLRTSLRFLPAAVVPVVAQNIDVLVYGATLPISQVGVYVVAKLGLSLYLPVATMLEGRVLAETAQRGARHALRRVALQGSVLGVAISGGGWLLLEPLFGSGFADAVWGLPLACAAGVLRLVHGALLVQASVRGRAGVSVVGSAALLAATIGGSVVVVLTGAGLLAMMAVLVVAQVVAVGTLACMMSPGRRKA